MPDANVIDAVRTPRSIGEAGRGALSAGHAAQPTAAAMRAILGSKSAFDAASDSATSAIDASRCCGSGVPAATPGAAQIVWRV